MKLPQGDGNVERDRTIDLPQGRIHYRDQGSGPTIFFMHGLLVDATLWRKVTPILEPNFRCIAPDLPLGSHREAMAPDADQSPRGVARLVADMLEALDLHDVAIVANDTGGAIAQMLVTRHPQRIGRLVLTPCDAYENFLPPAFRPMQWLAKAGLLSLAVQPLRIRALRSLPMAYGALTRKPIPHAVTDAWLRPYFADRGVRRDARRLVAAIDKRDTLQAAKELADFHAPTLLAWAAEDRFFKIEFAQRLAAAIPNSRLEAISDSGTFVPEDQPERLAALIAEFVGEGAPVAEAEDAPQAAAGTQPAGSTSAGT